MASLPGRDYRGACVLGSVMALPSSSESILGPDSSRSSTSPKQSSSCWRLSMLHGKCCQHGMRSERVQCRKWFLIIAICLES